MTKTEDHTMDHHMLPEEVRNDHRVVAATIADIVEHEGDKWNQKHWAIANDFVAEEQRVTFHRLFLSGHPAHPDDDDETQLIHNECGTAFCVAGWATVLTQPVRLEPRFFGEGDGVADLVNPVTGRRLSAEDCGAAALGLSFTSSRWLFDAIRTQGEVLSVLRAIAAGEDPNKAVSAAAGWSA